MDAIACDVHLHWCVCWVMKYWFFSPNSVYIYISLYIYLLYIAALLGRGGWVGRGCLHLHMYALYLAVLWTCKVCVEVLMRHILYTFSFIHSIQKLIHSTSAQKGGKGTGGGGGGEGGGGSIQHPDPLLSHPDPLLSHPDPLSSW